MFISVPCICSLMKDVSDHFCLHVRPFLSNQNILQCALSPLLTQCKCLHSLSVIKGYILHFTLTSKVTKEFTFLFFFNVHFFFKFTIVRSDEGRKRENVSFWGTPTLEICYCSTDNFKQHYNRFINSND